MLPNLHFEKYYFPEEILWNVILQNLAFYLCIMYRFEEKGRLTFDFVKKALCWCRVGAFGLSIKKLILSPWLLKREQKGFGVPNVQHHDYSEIGKMSSEQSSQNIQSESR